MSAEDTGDPQDLNSLNNPPSASTGAVARVRPDKSTGAIPKEFPPSTSVRKHKKKKSLRACLVCSMVKPLETLLVEGCDNCEEFLKMKNNVENINMCTTSLFDGVIYLKDPDWVVKWPRNITRHRGLYALCVCVKLPNGTIREMRAQPIHQTDSNPAN